MPKTICIIGGGITGLAAAHRLHKRAQAENLPVKIQLIEASSRLGGTLHSTARDGFLLEGGPDCFISEKSRAVELCQELGLADELIPTYEVNRRSFIVRKGKLHPVPEGFYLIAPSKLRPFLKSPLLSWKGKWRVLVESLLPGRPKGDESVASFVRRRLGQEALDWMAQPLLAGIYAADPETLSLKATFPQFLRMEEKEGSVLLGLKKDQGPKSKAQGLGSVKTASGARYSLFVSLLKGMQSLAYRLVEGLPEESILLNTAVTAVRRKPAGDGHVWELQLVKGQALEADAVCLALPAYGAGALLFAENPDLSDELKAIEYTSSATLNFAFQESAIRHPLDGFGFVVPKAEKRSTLACTFVHRKFPGRAPKGHALLRAFVGGALQSDVLRLNDQELEEQVFQDLQDLLGIDQRPLFAAVERWPRAMPQFTLGHVQRVLRIEETVLGMKTLAVAGNWLRGVGIPDCIESGERAADHLMG